MWFGGALFILRIHTVLIPDYTVCVCVVYLVAMGDGLVTKGTRGDLTILAGCHVSTRQQ